MNTQDKKYNYLLYFIGVIPVVWLALLIAPITEGGLVSIFNNFGNVFNNPFNILWSENSIKTILPYQDGLLLNPENLKIPLILYL